MANSDFDAKMRAAGRAKRLAAEMPQAQAEALFGKAFPGGVANQAGNTGSLIPQPPARPSMQALAEHALDVRMGWGTMYGKPKTPFDYIALHSNNDGTKVFTFIVLNGEAVVLEDTSGMYPCDETVTKIRMLLP